MRVWIDVTNSPHVVFFRPLVRLLAERGDDVTITARDFAQTLALCDRFGIAHEAIGHHRGGRLGAKAIGLFDRSFTLARWAKGLEAKGILLVPVCAAVASARRS